MLKDNMKKVASFVRDHRKEISSVLGGIEWLQLTQGRIVVDEDALNEQYLPLFKDHMPEEVEGLAIRIRDGYLEVKANVRVKGERIRGIYRIWIDQYVFDAQAHRFVLSYQEEIPFDTVPLGKRLLFSTGKFIMQAVTGQSLLGYAMKEKEGIEFDGNRMILDLDQIPAFQRLREKKFLGQPLIDRIKIKNITLEKEKLNVDISILGWDEPAPPYHELDTELIDENDRQEEGEQIDENLIRIERNHQRFYDKLRERIRIFIQEKGGEKADQSLRYLLVAPDLFVLLARLLKDPRVPLKSKSIVTAAIAYFITPVDIIPEFLTGPAGYLDDIVLAVLALKSILLDVDRRILEDHWNGEESLLSVIQDIVHRANDLVGSRTVSLIKKVLKK